MAKLERFWDWLTDRARVGHLSRDEIRAFAILNMICLMAMVSIVTVTTLILVAAGPLRQTRFDVVQNAISLVLYGLCWILVRRGNAVISSVILSLFGNLQITTLVLYYGFGGGIQWYYGVLMAAPLVTIPGKRQPLRMVLASLPLILFLWTHYEFRIRGRMPLAEADPGVVIFFFSNSLSSLLILGVMVAYFRYAAVRAESELEVERRRSDALLLNILPESIAGRLKLGEKTIADRFENVTVLFADLVHFTKMSAEIPPEEIVRILDEIFSSFDEAAARLGLEKVKTIGDAYMAIAGAPEEKPDHAHRAVLFGLEMLSILGVISDRLGRKLDLRIGIHTGPVVGGVIGRDKIAYDFWGDTVNTASRMESHGEAGSIHISEETRREIEGGFVTRERGRMEIKGKGVLQTYFVEARQPAGDGTTAGS
ncbi:MAG TPA: adenylate/guanylate cyclase domain-containing protein [Leptospiraceae bacterium]|nr:adenylate/guanylate cyclase domain-containing protein [Leptospiraceae bacterium]